MAGGVFIRFADRPGRRGAAPTCATSPGRRRPTATSTPSGRATCPTTPTTGARYAERREHLIAYAEQREEDERRRPTARRRRDAHPLPAGALLRGRVEQRADAGAGRALPRRALPGGAAVSVVHQDTAHTHAHVWHRRARRRRAQAALRRPRLPAAGRGLGARVRPRVRAGEGGRAPGARRPRRGPGGGRRPGRRAEGRTPPPPGAAERAAGARRTTGRARSAAMAR